MPLDFKRATDLFMGQEDELVRALSIDVAVLREHRARPFATPPKLLHAMADVLVERGQAMIRVSEMLREEAQESDGHNNGRQR